MSLPIIIIDDFSDYSDGQNLNGVGSWSNTETFTAKLLGSEMVGSLANTPNYTMQLRKQFGKINTVGYWFNISIWHYTASESHGQIEIVFSGENGTKTTIVEISTIPQSTLYSLAIPIGLSEIDEVQLNFTSNKFNLFYIDNLTLSALDTVSRSTFAPNDLILQQYKVVT